VFRISDTEYGNMEGWMKFFCKPQCKKSVLVKVENTLRARLRTNVLGLSWLLVYQVLDYYSLLFMLSRSLQGGDLLTNLDVVYLSYVGFQIGLGLFSLLFSISTLLSLLFLSILPIC